MERQSISDEDLRALVRESIGRLRDGAATPMAPTPALPPSAPSAPVHASHARFLLGTGGDETGACVIEPAVRCTHCGFCQSYGH